MTVQTGIATKANHRLIFEGRFLWPHTHTLVTNQEKKWNCHFRQTCRTLISVHALILQHFVRCCCFGVSSFNCGTETAAVHFFSAFEWTNDVVWWKAAFFCFPFFFCVLPRRFDCTSIYPLLDCSWIFHCNMRCLGYIIHMPTQHHMECIALSDWCYNNSDVDDAHTKKVHGTFVKEIMWTSYHTFIVSMAWIEWSSHYTRRPKASYTLTICTNGSSEKLQQQLHWSVTKISPVQPLTRGKHERLKMANVGGETKYDKQAETIMVQNPLQCVCVWHIEVDFAPNHDITSNENEWIFARPMIKVNECEYTVSGKGDVGGEE